MVSILALKYCDMTPESRKSPLLDNGSLTHVFMEMRIRGERLGTECAFHVNGINKGFHGYKQVTNIFYGYAQATNIFHGYVQATNVFHGYTLDYKSESVEEVDSVVLSSVVSHS
jgi:hypothetical protein